MERMVCQSHDYPEWRRVHERFTTTGERLFLLVINKYCISLQQFNKSSRNKGLHEINLRDNKIKKIPSIKVTKLDSLYHYDGCNRSAWWMTVGGSLCWRQSIPLILTDKWWVDGGGLVWPQSCRINGWMDQQKWNVSFYGILGLCIHLLNRKSQPPTIKICNTARKWRGWPNKWIAWLDNLAIDYF